MQSGHETRLERLCKESAWKDLADERARIRLGSGTEGIQRLEAQLHGHAFSPHRHDTYAIGVTLAGVQSFRFRGEKWHCLPGQCHVLHPDETHDGSAGTADGFVYRIVYVDPALIQDALGGKPLPFVAHPVIDATRLPEPRAAEIWNFEKDLDEVARAELVAAVVNLLIHASSQGSPKPAPLALDRLGRVRELIAASPAERRSLCELERVCGLDRWTLARQFRSAFGTSPSRFRTMRQLDLVRRSLSRGTSLVAASIEAGFADQSHMSRHFKSAYGLTPGEWVSAAVA
jgi:AraC-like DNA-binding protein